MVSQQALVLCWKLSGAQVSRAPHTHSTAHWERLQSKAGKWVTKGGLTGPEVVCHTRPQGQSFCWAVQWCWHAWGVWASLRCFTNDGSLGRKPGRCCRQMLCLEEHCPGTGSLKALRSLKERTLLDPASLKLGLSLVNG